jgi:hypothetical protein
MEIASMRLLMCSILVTTASSGLWADDESPLTYSAVTLSIASDGTGKVTVDSRDAEQAHAAKAPKAKPVEIAVFGEAEVFPAKEGRLHVRYDFGKFKALDQLKAPALNADEEKLFEKLSIDADEGALVLNPGENGKVRFRFPRVVQGPLDLKILLSGATEGIVQILCGFGSDVLIISLHGKNSPEKEEAGTVLVTLKSGDEFRSLVRATQPVAQRREFDFKIKPELIQQRTSVLIGVWGDIPIAIPRLEVIAKFSPSFGIGLAQKGTRVIAEKVIEGGAAAAAGIKVGDTILSVNDQAVEDSAGALKLLGDCPLDKDAVIVVERFGKKRTISVTPK